MQKRFESCVDYYCNLLISIKRTKEIKICLTEIFPTLNPFQLIKEESEGSSDSKLDSSHFRQQALTQAISINHFPSFKNVG
jgi:hypothetical protein